MYKYYIGLFKYSKFLTSYGNFHIERLKISEVEMKNKYMYLVALGLISFPLLSQAHQQKVYTSNSSPIEPNLTRHTKLVE